jgi:hypothetical protein
MGRPKRSLSERVQRNEDALSVRKAAEQAEKAAQDATQAAERSERAYQASKEHNKRLEAATTNAREKHGVRSLLPLCVESWPPVLRDAYNTALDSIKELSGLDNPRFRLAGEQAARMTVLVGLLYQYLVKQLRADGEQPPAILKQIATYENSLNRMLQGLGLTLTADWRRLVQPESPTSYFGRVEDAQTEEVGDGGNGQDKPTD